MKKEELSELIKVFAKRGTLEEKIWFEYKQAKKKILEDISKNKILLDWLLDILQQTKEPTVIENILEIIKEVGNLSIIKRINLLAEKSNTLKYFGIYFHEATFFMFEQADRIKKYKKELRKKPLKELIPIFGHRGEPMADWAEYKAAYDIFLKEHNNIVNFILDVVGEWLDLNKSVDLIKIRVRGKDEKKQFQILEQELLRHAENKSDRFGIDFLMDPTQGEVPEPLRSGSLGKSYIKSRYIIDFKEKIIYTLSKILGEIGDIKAIPQLRQVLLGYLGMGITMRTVAVALIKLGDNFGLDWMRKEIMDVNSHPEMRFNAVSDLVYLGISSAFRKDENIDFSGIPRPEIREKMQRLINDFLT